MTRRKKTKSIKLLKGEKFLSIMILILLVSLPIGTVFTKAVLSETNISVEQLKVKIADQEGKNESLNMQIDELASLDKIQEVATEQGLSYNNTNIKNINE